MKGGVYRMLTIGLSFRLFGILYVQAFLQGNRLCADELFLTYENRPGLPAIITYEYEDQSSRLETGL